MLPKTFEEACTSKGYDPAAILPVVVLFPEKHQKAIIAYSKLIIVSEAINEGWEPDWNDGNEYKYLPWFDMEVEKNNTSGFRFYVTTCDYSATLTTGGSRLCFKTSKLAQYAGKQFLDLWRDMMVIAK